MKKYLFYSLALFGVLALGAGIASAHGFGFGFGKIEDPAGFAAKQQEMFQNQADMIGISVDDLKNAWAEGKNMWQIAEDNGMTKEQIMAKMEEIRKSEMKDRLQMLVDQGVLTQAQADARYQHMEEIGGRGFGMLGGGRGRGGHGMGEFMGGMPGGTAAVQ